MKGRNRESFLFSGTSPCIGRFHTNFWDGINLKIASATEPGGRFTTLGGESCPFAFHTKISKHRRVFYALFGLSTEYRGKVYETVSRFYRYCTGIEPICLEDTTFLQQ